MTDLRGDEVELMRRHGLSAEQIGFRRGLKQSFRGLRRQEFAEDAVSCFKASGECCFEIEVIEERLSTVPQAVETRRGGALLIWLPAIAGKEYLVAVDTAGGGSEETMHCGPGDRPGDGLTPVRGAARATLNAGVGAGLGCAGEKSMAAR